MNDSDILTLSTCTTPEHGISEETLKSVLKNANYLTWNIYINSPIDWITETIGNKRLEALNTVKTDFVFCLDSDDMLVNSFPLNLNKYTDYNAWIFQSIRPVTGAIRDKIKGRASTQSATQRVVFRKSFLQNILKDLIQSTCFVREDVYMMWRVLEDENFCYFPYPILNRIGPSRCSKNDEFNKRHIPEKKVWEDIFTQEKRKHYNSLLEKKEIKQFERRD